MLDNLRGQDASGAVPHFWPSWRSPRNSPAGEQSISQDNQLHSRTEFCYQQTCSALDQDYDFVADAFMSSWASVLAFFVAVAESAWGCNF